MGVSINGGYPKLDCFSMGSPHLKWMMTGGTPILGNLQMVSIEGTLPGPRLADLLINRNSPC